MKDVERLLKLDPTNTELLKQKQQLLAEAVGETKNKLDTLKDAEKQVQDQFQQGKVSQEQYDALKREIVATEEQLKSLEQQAEKSNTTLQQISEAGKQLQEFGSKATAAGQAMMPLTTAIAGIGTAAVKTTADFDEAMSKVAAISGASGADFDKLRDKAREMGEKTKFSATEAAEAFTYMAMAGWDVEKMMNGIDGVMNLAAADGLDLATTSDIVTDAMTAFGLQASESAHFADVLAKASSSANTNVSMLGESFKYVAPVAGTLGYTAEDTAAALGLMANAGIKGSQAGTSLKTALANMASPTKNMVGVMNEFDLSLQNSDGSMKSLKEVMDMLRTNMAMTTEEQRAANYAMEEQAVIASGNGKQLEGLTDAQKKLALQQSKGIDIVESLNEETLKAEANARLGIKLTKTRKLTEEEYYELAQSMGMEALQGIDEAQQAAAASTLFGKEAMAGMLNIINASEEDYNKLTEAIYNADGTAKDMAETMQDNLSGQLTILKSQLQEAAISIGDSLVPKIREVIAKIQEWVDWFNSLNDSQKETVVAVAAVVAAIGPLLLITGQIASSIGSILSLATQIGALGAAGGPVMLAVAAVAALGTAFVAAKVSAVDYYGEAARLTDAELENQAAVKSLLESYNSLSESRRNAVSDIEAQTDKEKSLWEELQNITDENGKVKAGYEDRAAFITSELSKALNTEISITDGVIQNYKDLQAEIDNLIEKKRAEATLNAFQGEYAEAISNTKKAQTELAEATVNAQDAAEKYNKAVEEQNHLQAELNALMERYQNLGNSEALLNQQLTELNNQMGAAGETVAGLKAHMEESNQTLADAKTAVEEYNTTIANYEGAAAAIMSGDQLAISEALLLLTNDFKTAETSTAESLRNQSETISTELANARTAFEQGTPGITQAYISELEQLEQKASTELSKLEASAGQAVLNAANAVRDKAPDMEQAGNDFSAGLAKGIEAGTDQAIESAGKMADESVDALRTALDSHSPSHVTHDVGVDFSSGYAEGIIDGGEQAVNATEQVAQTTVETLQMSLATSQQAMDTFQATSSTNWIVWATGLVTSLNTSLNQINMDTTNNLIKMQNTLTMYLARMKQEWEKQLTAIRQNHEENMKLIRQKHEETMDVMTIKTEESMQAMTETTRVQTETMKQQAITAMFEMVEGTGRELSNLEPTVREGFEPAISYITNLIPQFRTWGNHMMQELIQGLEDYLDELESICEEIADTISANLHFTRPDRGSLRNYEEWMPHFMQGLAKGIEDNKYLVTRQIQQLADDMSLSMSDAGGVARQPINLNNYTVLTLDGKVIAEAVDEQLGILL